MPDLLIPKYTEGARQEFLRNGEQSLAFFVTTILGWNYWIAERGKSLWRDDLQGDLCRFLEGRAPYKPWNRAVVSAFRGMGKSTITTQGYVLQRTLYGRNRSVKIVGNSADNVKLQHFLPMRDLFRFSARSDFLQWLYQERIPPGFDGWNSEQIVWVSDPKAPPAITYWGVESKMESYHGDLIVLDDLEGADAGRSNVSSEMAYDTYLRAVPLLADPSLGQVLSVGTPHGENPYVHRMKDRRDHVVWWREVLDEKGEPRDPERYTPAVIESLQADPRLWNQQYMLRKDVGGDTPFDLVAYDKALWRWHPTQPRKICYPGYDFKEEKKDDLGVVVPKTAEQVADLREMLFFLHLDPKHRTRQQRRTKQTVADHAAAVVGVTPDLHVFLVDYWTGDCEIDEYLRRCYRLYCRYAVSTVTYESVGAQLWLHDIVKHLELLNPQMANPETFGDIMPPIRLPRMSARMFEGDKVNESKDLLYRERLTPWINLGLFHGPSGAKGEKFRYQLEHVLEDTVEKDLLDCVVQGPGKHPVTGRIVWRAPMGELHERELVLRRQWVERRADPRTGFSSPYAVPQLSPPPPR